jgi:hypothetical protein
MHPRADLCLCSLPELHYLYAMAKQIHCSPVRTMLAQWQKMISGKSPIDMTSLVTRIARYIGVMDNAEVTFMWRAQVLAQPKKIKFCSVSEVHKPENTKNISLE